MTVGDIKEWLTSREKSGLITSETPVVFGVASDHVEITSIRVRECALRKEDGHRISEVRKVLLS